MRTLKIANPNEVRQAAKDFIREVDVRHAVIAFYGAMGVGKTTFIKALCEELGVEDVINSPTFAIINEYRSRTTGGRIFHFDFYRIEQFAEAQDIGTEDYLNSGALCLIEWPEIIESILPDDTIRVTITEEEDGLRTVVF